MTTVHANDASPITPLSPSLTNQSGRRVARRATRSMPTRTRKVPRRKKKDETDALYDEVLADATGGQLVPKKPSETEPAALDAKTSEPPAATTDAATTGRTAAGRRPLAGASDVDPRPAAQSRGRRATSPADSRVHDASASGSGRSGLPVRRTARRLAEQRQRARQRPATVSVRGDPAGTARARARVTPVAAAVVTAIAAAARTGSRSSASSRRS